MLQLKNEMTAITQRISSGEASDADRARYRELGERLKYS
jgi:DNA primase